jgi:DNA-binding NarL/FixJ family response regulator
MVLDFHRPDIESLEATATFKAQWPNTRVVMLTMSPAHRAVALATGLDAYLLKGCPAQEPPEVISG